MYILEGQIDRSCFYNKPPVIWVIWEKILYRFVRIVEFSFLCLVTQWKIDKSASLVLSLCRVYCSFVSLFHWGSVLRQCVVSRPHETRTLLLYIYTIFTCNHLTERKDISDSSSVPAFCFYSVAFVTSFCFISFFVSM